MLYVLPVAVVGLEKRWWGRGIRFIEEWANCDDAKKEWGVFGVIARLPIVRKWMSMRIVHLKFGK